MSKTHNSHQAKHWLFKIRWSPRTLWTTGFLLILFNGLADFEQKQPGPSNICKQLTEEHLKWPTGTNTYTMTLKTCRGCYIFKILQLELSGFTNNRRRKAQYDSLSAFERKKMVWKGEGREAPAQPPRAKPPSEQPWGVKLEPNNERGDQRHRNWRSSGAKFHDFRGVFNTLSPKTGRLATSQHWTIETSSKFGI